MHDRRRAGLSTKTVQNHLNFLHGIFAFSIKREWASANPVALVDRPKAARSAHRRIRFLQPPELDALIRAVPPDLLGAVERPLYLAAAMTVDAHEHAQCAEGARQSEVAQRPGQRVQRPPDHRQRLEDDHRDDQRQGVGDATHRGVRAP